MTKFLINYDYSKENTLYMRQFESMCQKNEKGQRSYILGNKYWDHEDGIYREKEYTKKKKKLTCIYSFKLISIVPSWQIIIIINITNIVCWTNK